MEILNVISLSLNKELSKKVVVKTRHNYHTVNYYSVMIGIIIL